MSRLRCVQRRCEVVSSLLKQRGLASVYQLQGGVLGYGAAAEGETADTSHWEGNLFVFDDR